MDKKKLLKSIGSLEAMKSEIKYHGGVSARLAQTDKEINIVWIEEK